MNSANIIVGIICSIIGAFATAYTMNKSTKDEVRKDTTDFTRVESKLDYVSKGVDDIRLEIKDQGRQITDINERLVRVEESTKSAHRRIDNIENRKDEY